LIRRLVLEGNDVWTSFPNGPFGEGKKSAEEFGCHFIETKMNRWGTSIWHDIKLLLKYIKLIRRLSPDVVLAFTVKPDIYGGIACRICKTPFLPNITGIGKGLDEGGFIAKIICSLYRVALSKARCVFFQNEQDREYFRSKSINTMADCVLPGSGVNLDEFIPLEYPPEKPIRFIFIGRIMKAKGIDQYLEAAKQIRKRHGDAEFHVCGYLEEDYMDVFTELQESGTIIYHGLVGDMTSFLSQSHCVILPTSHPEGVSNVLLEGAACARPLITTNRHGCRETVDDSVTGFLIKEYNSGDLIEKIERFIALTNNEQRDMGLAGRHKVEQSFDRNIVVEQYLRVIGSCAKKSVLLR